MQEDNIKTQIKQISTNSSFHLIRSDESKKNRSDKMALYYRVVNVQALDLMFAQAKSLDLENYRNLTKNKIIYQKKSLDLE